MPFFKVNFATSESSEMDRQRSCVGKVRYGHEETAWREAKRLRSLKNRRLEPYPCEYCEGWHLGHEMPTLIKWLLSKARRAKEKMSHG